MFSLSLQRRYDRGERVSFTYVFTAMIVSARLMVDQRSI